MKKRGMALILAGVLSVSVLAACGSDSGKDAAAAATPTAAAAPTEAAPTEAPEEEPEDVPEEEADEEEEADFSVIAGGWYYQLADQDDQTEFTSVGVMEIGEDGSFSYTSNEGETRSGKVRSGYEEFSDGSRIPMFGFFEEGTEPWISCYYNEEDPDNLWIGNGGMERLTRGGHGSPQQGQGRNEFIGSYTEPRTGRCLITMDTEDGINYTVSVVWGASAYETAYWEIGKAVYGESSGELEYSDARFYVRTFTDETTYTDDVRYTDGTGRFWFDEDGMLCWVSDNSELDEYDGQTLFERMPD